MKLKTIIISLLLLFIGGISVSCDDSSNVESETKNVFEKYNVDDVYGGPPQKEHVLEAEIVEFVGWNKAVVKVTKTDDEVLFLNNELIYVETWDYSYVDKEKEINIGTIGYDEKSLPEDMKMNIGDSVRIIYYWSDLQVGDDGLAQKNDMKLLNAVYIVKYIDVSELEKTDISEWLLDRRCSYAEAVITEVRSKEMIPEEELVVEVVQDLGGSVGEYVKKGEKVLVDYVLYSLREINLSFRNPDVASSIILKPGAELDETHSEYELKVGDRIIVQYDIVDEKDGMTYFRLCRVIKLVYR